MDYFRLLESYAPAFKIPRLNVAPSFQGRSDERFLSFLEYHHLELEDLVEGHKPSIWKESFLQEWLWFAVLYEFLDCFTQDWNLNAFIISEDDGQFVDSKPLVSFFQAASKNVLRQKSRADFGALLLDPESYFSLWRRRLHDVLRKASIALKVSQYRGSFVRFEIGASIHLLHLALAQFFNFVFGTEAPLSTCTELHKEILELLKIRGWCPSLLRRLRPNYEAMAIITLYKSGSSVLHNCPETGCQQFAQRVNRHVTDDCACEPIEFYEHNLKPFFESGTFPVVTRSFRNGKVWYTLSSARATRYGAISHVWSQGIGIDGQNAILECQLSRLFEFFIAIDREVMSYGLWIDHISVPISENLRRQAIVGMREIYEKAAFTLVVDLSLLEIGSDVFERRLRLLSCEWSYRLWTFQEARLSSILFVQFKDEALPVSQILGNTYADRENQRLLQSHLGKWLEGCGYGNRGDVYVKDGAPEDNFEFQLDRMLSEVTWRRTTKAIDEPLCLLNLIPKDIIIPPGGPSMADFFTQLETFPRDVLFSMAPRLQTPGFTWAPSTLLTGESMGLDWRYWASITNQGLQCKADCISLLDVTAIEDANPKGQYAGYWGICRDVPQAGSCFTWECSSDISRFPPGSLAVILQNNEEFLKMAGFRSHQESGYQRAILLTNVSTEQGVTKGHWQEVFKGRFDYLIHPTVGRNEEGKFVVEFECRYTKDSSINLID